MNLFTKIVALTAQTTVTAEAAPQLVFEPKNFVEMLGYMGKGMLVIFVIIGVIILATLLINKLFSKK